MFAEIANGTTWYRDISCLPLKPPQSFKPRIVIKTGFFVFLWIWPEPVRGSQREENFQKTSLKARKTLSAFRSPSFLFFKLVSSTFWPFYYLMYASFRSITAKNGKVLTPTRMGNFCWPQWTRNSTRRLPLPPLPLLLPLAIPIPIPLQYYHYHCHCHYHYHYHYHYPGYRYSNS